MLTLYSSLEHFQEEFEDVSKEDQVQPYYDTASYHGDGVTIGTEATRDVSTTLVEKIKS